MKPLILILSIYLSASTLFAQSLERFVIGSAGLSPQNEDLQLSFTAGEAIVSGLNADDIQLSQGFQQANIEDITTGFELPHSIEDIIAYPNPTGSVLYIDIHTQKEFEFSYLISDLTGRQLALPPQPGGNTGVSQHQIDLTGLTPGIYLMMIKTKDGVPVKVFKIQKY